MSRTGIVLLAVLGLCLASVGWSLLKPAHPRPLPPLQVEVWNACGVDGLAQGAAGRLRALGQDVVAVGDFGEILPRSVLLDRRGRPGLSRRLASRIGPLPLLLERLEEPTADVTLVLGADHARLALFGP